MSDYLQPHEPQHARPPCPSPTPGVYPNSCPSSQWYHPTISSSVVPFSCLQSCPASGSFQMSQLFAAGGQSIGVSASTSILSMNTQDWFPLGMDWLDLLEVQGILKSLLQHHSSKASILRCSAFFIVQLSHPYMTTGKTIALTSRTFVGKVMSLLFNMLSRLVITFLPRSKRFLISWQQSPSTVILDHRLKMHKPQSRWSDWSHSGFFPRWPGRGWGADWWNQWWRGVVRGWDAAKGDLSHQCGCSQKGPAKETWKDLTKCLTARGSAVNASQVQRGSRHLEMVPNTCASCFSFCLSAPILVGQQLHSHLEKEEGERKSQLSTH